MAEVIITDRCGHMRRFREVLHAVIAAMSRVGFAVSSFDPMTAHPIDYGRLVFADSETAAAVHFINQGLSYRVFNSSRVFNGRVFNGRGPATGTNQF
jgi:hypothetical protein